MNLTILTIIIAASALILSIFAASWLNLRSIDKLFERMDKHNEKLFERLDKQLAAQFGEVRAEFAAVRAEIAALRAEVMARIDALEDKVDRLDRQMAAIFKPVLPKS